MRERQRETEQTREMARLQFKLDAAEDELLTERRLCRRLQEAYLRHQAAREMESRPRTRRKVRSVGSQTSGEVHERLALVWNESSRSPVYTGNDQAVSFRFTPPLDDLNHDDGLEMVEVSVTTHKKSAWWEKCPASPEQLNPGPTPQSTPRTPEMYREYSSPTFIESPRKSEDGEASQDCTLQPEYRADQPCASSRSTSCLVEDDAYSSENEFEVTDGKVQLGGNVTLDQEDYEAMMESPSDQKFWNAALTSIWTLDELLGRSVTGAPSRSSGKRRRRHVKPGLDPIKMQAAKRAYRRYIRLFPTGGDPTARVKKARVYASASLVLANRNA